MNVLELLQKNFAFQAAILGLVATLVSAAKGIPGKLFITLQRQFVVTIDVLSGDNLFDWLKIWFDSIDYADNARLLSASVSQNEMRNIDGGEIKTPKIIFSPAPGSHFFRYKKKLILVQRTRKEDDGKGGGYGYWRESFTLKVLGRKQTAIRNLLEEAVALVNNQNKKKIGLFSFNLYSGWDCVGWKQPRPIDSVILPEGVMETLINDITTFRASENWYADMGIPYHRGYLFYGLPGTGKSSLAIALAGAFKLNIYLMSLTGAISDERLRSALAQIPQGSIVLLEDIDTVFQGRKKIGGSEKDELTFSGFLNALDGVASSEGRITILTTNHIEDLDSALTRPGRSDVKIEFEYATNSQIKSMFCRFFNDSIAAELFAENVGTNATMAMIQKHLLENKDCKESALSNYKA